MKNRFDMEQEIMDCWHIIDDVKTLSGAWDTLTEDQKQNILIGIRDLYSCKFEQLFETFESLVNNRTL